jgi:hypothetical protein
MNSYKDNIEDEYDEYTIINHEIKNLNEIEKPLVELFEFTTSPELINGNSIYFNPFAVKDFEKNPFTLRERLYPVDFGYKRAFNYNLVLTIPNSYQIKSIPESKKIITPNKGTSLSYLIKSTENKITINLNFVFNKTKYASNEYDNLKKLLSELISSQKEMIILTKK